jgi:hypothetical protein
LSELIINGDLLQDDFLQLYLSAFLVQLGLRAIKMINSDQSKHLKIKVNIIKSRDPKMNNQKTGGALCRS